MEDCQQAFEHLEKQPAEILILAHPLPDVEFILDTDASNFALGAVICQDGTERVIAYFCKTLGRSERNFCATRKELLATVKSVEHFHHYLYGRKFLIMIDHTALRWFLSFKNVEGQIARWIERLQQYDFEIKHREGKMHGNADGLSRRPCEAQCK